MQRSSVYDQNFDVLYTRIIDNLLSLMIKTAIWNDNEIRIQNEVCAQFWL